MAALRSVSRDRYDEDESPPAGDRVRITHHPESWAIRAAILATLVFQAATRTWEGVLPPVEGLVLSFVPLLFQRWSGIHVQRRLELAWSLIVALQFISESLKLYEVYYYWDKFAHPAEVFLATYVFGLLLLGWIDTYRIRLPRTFAAAIAMLFGITLGASWEFLEFLSDWFGNADLQKSNADTMTDVFSNDIGAIIATLLAFWLYHHRHTTAHQRQELGQLARWLTDGPGKLLNRHGRLIGAIFFLAIAVLAGAAWLVDRRPAPLPPGLTAGVSQTWHFMPASPDPLTEDQARSSPATTAVLLGDWRSEERGACRINVQQPRPGSEKAGLLALGLSSGYGLGGAPFEASTRYFQERPPQNLGSQMTGGIAFGVRSPGDFYLLEASALHDFVRLDRFIHGRRRDLREERVRTHANEWHELRVRVEGDRVGAFLDNRAVFIQTRLNDTDGGLGLWARVTATACFSEASVTLA